MLLGEHTTGQVNKVYLISICSLNIQLDEVIESLSTHYYSQNFLSALVLAIPMKYFVPRDLVGLYKWTINIKKELQYEDWEMIFGSMRENNANKT